MQRNIKKLGLTIMVCLTLFTGCNKTSNLKKTECSEERERLTEINELIEDTPAVYHDTHIVIDFKQEQEDLRNFLNNSNCIGQGNV